MVFYRRASRTTNGGIECEMKRGKYRRQEVMQQRFGEFNGLCGGLVVAVFALVHDVVAHFEKAFEFLTEEEL